MRIVGISGIHSCNNPIWTQFRVAFSELLPESELFVEEEEYCGIFNLNRFNDLRRRLIAKYNDRIPTLFVGHSMGGLVACKVASELHKIGTPISGVVTIFTPHGYPGLPGLLEVPEDPGVPVVSFQATIDILVWFGTRHPYAISHTVVDSYHQHVICETPHVARQIVKASLRDLRITPGRVP